MTLLLAVFVAFANVIGYAFIKAITPITDIEQYVEVRSQFGDADYIHHFPLTIPPEAIEAQLYYLPGALQGEMFMQLRVALPEAAWRNVQAEYESQAIHMNSSHPYWFPDGGWVMMTRLNFLTLIPCCFSVAQKIRWLAMVSLLIKHHPKSFIG